MERYAKFGIANGVIIILLNKNEETRHLLQASLRLFSATFLDCYPYDVHIFHEHILSRSDQEAIQGLTKSHVTFEYMDLPRMPLPLGLTVEEVKPWNKWGLGYRQMCRFFSGKLYQLPSMMKYDWYWRMDTDSWYACTKQGRWLRFASGGYGHPSATLDFQEVVGKNSV